MKKWTSFVVALAMALAGASAVATAETGITDSEIRIGMWTPLSGPVSLLGESARDGLRVWAKEVNDAGGIDGRKINLIVYDDAASPQEAQAAIRRLLGQDEVFMLIGGSVSGSTLPVRHVITREKVPFIASISSNINLMDPPSRYIFRIYANEIHQARSITDWMIEHVKIQRPAIIYNSNDYGVGGFQVFEQRLQEKHDMEPVAAERYNPGDQDFSAQLLRIKEAKPDGLLVFSFAAEAGIIVRQAKELGLDAKLFGGGGTATPLFQRGAGKAAAGFVADFVLPQLPHSDAVPAVVNYREKLKEWFYPGGFPPGRPSEYDLAGYGAGKVAEEALRRAGPNPTRESFVDALEKLTNFETGVTFPVTYSDDHEATEKVLIVRVNDDLEWEPHPEYKPKN